jgi:hypothetical protein
MPLIPDSEKYLDCELPKSMTKRTIETIQKYVSFSRRPLPSWCWHFLTCPCCIRSESNLREAILQASSLAAEIRQGTWQDPFSPTLAAATERWDEGEAAEKEVEEDEGGEEEGEEEEEAAEESVQALSRRGRRRTPAQLKENRLTREIESISRSLFIFLPFANPRGHSLSAHPSIRRAMKKDYEYCADAADTVREMRLLSACFISHHPPHSSIFPSQSSPPSQWFRGKTVWIKWTYYYTPAKVLGMVREVGSDQSSPCMVYVVYFGPGKEM